MQLQKMLQFCRLVFSFLFRIDSIFYCVCIDPVSSSSLCEYLERTRCVFPQLYSVCPFSYWCLLRCDYGNARNRTNVATKRRTQWEGERRKKKWKSILMVAFFVLLICSRFTSFCASWKRWNTLIVWWIFMRKRMSPYGSNQYWIDIIIMLI